MEELCKVRRLKSIANKAFELRKKILEKLIPGSDSGKAEEAWGLRICFSFDRGFVPASCTLPALRNHPVDDFSDRHSHLQESRAFGYFFAEKKYQEDLKFKGQMNLKPK